MQDSPAHTPFRLTRTGDKPLVFDGELLAEVSNGPEERSRDVWHKIALYRTAGGKHFLEVVASNVDKGPQHDVFETWQEDDGSWESLFDRLRNYNPLRYVDFTNDDDGGKWASRLTKDRYRLLVTEFAERLGAEDRVE